MNKTNRQNLILVLLAFIASLLTYINIADGQELPEQTLCRDAVTNYLNEIVTETNLALINSKTIGVQTLQDLATTNALELQDLHETHYELCPVFIDSAALAFNMHNALMLELAQNGEITTQSEVLFDIMILLRDTFNEMDTLIILREKL